MTQASLSDLKGRISDLARKSAIADRVEDIIVEADDEDGGDFLRVIVAVTSFDDVNDLDLAALASSIEKTVSALDERFPSVRFADAA